MLGLITMVWVRAQAKAREGGGERGGRRGGYEGGGEDAFCKNKGRLTFMKQKTRRGMKEFYFSVLTKFTIFFFHLSFSHPHHSSSSFFPIRLSHASPFSRNIFLICSVTARLYKNKHTGRNQRHMTPPTLAPPPPLPSTQSFFTLSFTSSIHSLFHSVFSH